jgi:15-cis-phytoene synthase
MDSLDDIVRQADPDRWMASRFIADPQARADVIALYALNDELARVAPSVRTPMLGEIRFAWWREGLEEGRTAHPVLKAMAGVMARRNLPTDRLDALIAARHADLDPAAFADEAALYGYLDGATGTLMALAAAVLGAPDALSLVLDAGRAWGIAGLARAHWAAGAPNRLPPDWAATDVQARVAAAMKRARAELKALPVGAFPAVAYAALAPSYAARRAPGPLGQQARMTWAVARGRI